ncbi:hydrophobe/amphiphile efflux-3 (HAE3) family transporter [Methanospirillum sp. J.3.6.1-F.2.7.3]|uniref:Hydrophobe/amphiphile efflux-3 (HAE3) family transporter n=1 Tax=Methanospirillum purgamenti TaxID=2834276 RepID=A0A8E7AUR9_9EURY|nr:MULTISPECIES: hydrophobe/amphiphile efflux-3 (HAE3) family transporter [Methanospirillum]MDX8551657.1 hydrophobe/amphiphile efflux-3 (HAE3) family transporter [Methanospirillum hungatei]QVV87650.1 hydrophobe/amphiphile efflux-3 (HAE3) family transporter [Methanospirillum sp. J.3.6.1-F.2.7.3]
MRSIFESISSLIVNKPKIVFGVLFLVFITSVIGMSMLTMQTGNDTYLDKNTPKGIAFSHYEDTFSQDTLVILIESNDPLSPDVIKYIDQISRPLQNLQYISSVSSIADLVKQANDGEIPRSSGEIKKLKESIPSEVLERYIPSNLLTMMMIKLDVGMTEQKQKSVMNNVRSFLDSTSPPPGVTVTLTGNPVFQQEMGEELSKSMGTLIMGAMVLMVIVLGLLFAYVSHRFIPVLIVAIGLILTFGIMGLFGVSINTAVIAAFPVLIGLGIDYAIQFHARLEEEARKGSLADAVRMTITRTGPAVMFAMLATTMGFIAMFISPVPMIRSFGLVAIIGVVVCYFTSLIGIPLIAVLIKYKPKGRIGEEKPTKADMVLSKTAVAIAKNPVPILMIAVLFAFIGLQVDSTIPISTSERTFVPSDMPAKISMDKVSRTIGSTTPVPVLIAGDNVLSPDVLKWIESYQQNELKLYMEITGSTSIVDYIKIYNNGTIPSTQFEIEEVITKIPEGIRNEFVNGRTETVIEFSTKRLEMPQQDELKTQMNNDLILLTPPPGIKASITGSFDLFTTLISDIAESKEQMTLLGFVLIVAFLALIYRKIHAVTPIVPIVCIVGWNAVAMLILNIDYTPMTACLGSMTIGVAAEYTILIMERYLEERETAASTIDAIRESVRKIGSAIMVSGFATFFGFSALMLSNFNMISNFGLTTVIAVLFSLIGAVAIMPAVLSVLDELIHDVHDIEDRVLHHPHKE